MRDDTRQGKLVQPRRLVLEERHELLAVEHAVLAEDVVVEVVQCLVAHRETPRVIRASALPLEFGGSKLVREVGHVALDCAVRGRRGRLRNVDVARRVRHRDCWL